MTETARTTRGGEWLVADTDPATMMTRERITDEHRLIEQTAREFMDGEVLPVLDRLEQKEWALNRILLQKCGALGLLGTNVPDTYGGVDLDKVATLIVSERLAANASFATTFGAQANLTILPIFMFGTEAQKAKYLPGLVAGDVAGAYCLSETGSGSDALGARAKATRQADGSFVLSGEKMWITNGGFADVFIVFAKVDGQQFTAFIVERAWPGVSSGQEEHKMGLHGSSTTPVLLQDVKVPADAVLGEIGKGHKVAFNVLNFGRFKLGAMTSGGAKDALADAAKYAASRKQFGVAIATFGAIKHKLGEMTAREYALESLMYRTAGLVDETVAANGGSPAAVLAALEEYAVEASIAKVYGSEVVDYVIDESVQILGGNGFVADYPGERRYRDARVNRIFEGTNEINRLLIPGMLIKKSVRGDLPLMKAAKVIQDELMAPPAMPASDDLPLADERRGVAAFKKVALFVAGAAMQRFGDALEHEQEVLSSLADIVIDAYATESAVLRALAAASGPEAALHAATATVVAHEAAGRIELAARAALAALGEGDTLRTHLAALRRLLKLTPVNLVTRRRLIADAAVARGGYPFA
ncbi:MAG: acyl-CoA dehydrogenase family protein [Acidobacteria bacterium]|nr:acyl-CoA dehydrogenase family protein [Acidobacteriota bacterium]